MLTAAELDSIEQTVTKHFGPPPYAGRAAAFHNYQACVAAVLKSPPPDSTASNHEIAVGVAAAIMAPYGARLYSGPGHTHLAALLKLSGGPPPLALDKIFELTIAYGMAWGRTATGNGWDGRWHGAAAALVDMVAKAVAAAHAVLPSAAERSIDADAADIFAWLLQPFGNVHERDSTRAARYGLKIRLAAGNSARRVEISDPAYLREPPAVLPPGAVQTYHLHVADAPGASPLTVQAGDGAAITFPAVQRIAIRADAVAPVIDIVPPHTVAGVHRIPLTPGPSVIFSVPHYDSLQAWQCLCGSGFCAQWHRLEAWSPAIPLAEFIARAVAKTPPQAGGQSMCQALCL